MDEKYNSASADENVNAKLCKEFIGPYTIVHKLAENLYELAREGRIIRGSCHAKGLKKHHLDTWKTEEKNRQNRRKTKIQHKPAQKMRQKGAQVGRKRIPAHHHLYSSKMHNKRKKPSGAASEKANTKKTHPARSHAKPTKKSDSAVRAQQ